MYEKEGYDMNAAERREALLQALSQSAQPVSATALAQRFSVSRQIIVGDIALLRAGGANIASTPRGYLVPRESGGLLRTLVCRHSSADLGPELIIMVDNGCTVIDVAVEHPVYGQLSGRLELSSRYDVQEFLRRVADEAATPLSALTDGVHLHTLRCPDEQAFQRVTAALGEAGFLFSE